MAIVGNAFELGENNRFRFMVEPLLFALVAWLLDAVARRLRRRRAARGADPGVVAGAPRPGTRPDAA